MSPAELREQLKAYSTNPTGSEDLVQLVRPARLHLRSIPSSRKEYGRVAGFWEALGSTWQGLAKRFSSNQDSDESKAAIPAIQALSAFLIGLTTMDNYNQSQALQHIEPHLRSILLTSSSLFNLEDPLYQPMTRTCCQALANLVTSNPSASSSYFPKRLEAEESDQLLQRLLATPDEPTLQAVLVFLLNSIHSSPERALLLGTSKTGSAILDRMMMLVSVTYDNDSKERPAPINEDGSDLFSLSFAIVKQLIESRVFPETYSAHKLLPGFVVSETLIVLLKFLDGYLSSQLSSSSPSASALVVLTSLLPFLHSQLRTLAENLLGKEERERSDALGFQAVVLVLHCLCEIGLGIDRGLQKRLEVEEPDEEDWEDGETGLQAESGSAIELVVRLLHFSSTSIPAPSARPPPNSTAKISEIDPDNPASIPTLRTVEDGEDVTLDSAGFQQMKLICVKFLGIVSFQTPIPPTNISQRARNDDVRRSVIIMKHQDLIRESGGLGLLLGLCQIDGRNPTLREHALFAIRNALKNNLKNQEYIEGMKPQFKVGTDGSLEDLPPALR
ncbi:Ctr86p [Sporobolomyces salmoneus]|uniref:Ctr86p n=1 Tax=Sporobolomyces salmoneus TaxID=183962 RepID=UPI00316B2E99